MLHAYTGVAQLLLVSLLNLAFAAWRYNGRSVCAKLTFGGLVSWIHVYCMVIDRGFKAYVRNSCALRRMILS